MDYDLGFSDDWFANDDEPVESEVANSQYVTPDQHRDVDILESAWSAAQQPPTPTNEVQVDYSTVFVYPIDPDVNYSVDETMEIVAQESPPPVGMARKSKAKCQTTQRRRNLLPVELDPYDKEKKAEWLEMIEATQQFNERRVKANISQYQVSSTLVPVVNIHLSQTMISRYENASLSMKNLKRLREILEAWLGKLNEAERAGKTPAEFVNDALEMALEAQLREQSMDDCVEGDSPAFTVKRRRKRTRLTADQEKALVRNFNIIPSPTYEQLDELATVCGLPTPVVKVWFANRRAALKRKANNGDEETVDPALPTVSSFEFSGGDH